LNSDIHTYQNCLSHCAKGVRCRFAAGRVEAHRCALLCAGILPGRPARSRRIWFVILRKGNSHGHR